MKKPVPKRLKNSLPICSLLLCLLGTAPAFSQQRWSIGPRVGANFANQMGFVASTKWLTGWSAGGFIMYSDINHFGVSGDILYSQKGARFGGALPNGRPFAYTQRINYLEVPILGRYFLTLSGKFRPNVFIGPAVAFKLGAKQKNREENGIALPETDNSDQYRPADLGVVGGVALNFEVAKGKRILIDARYTYGLADVTLAGNRIRNAAATLHLSYGFGIGKKYGR